MFRRLENFWYNFFLNKIVNLEVEIMKFRQIIWTLNNAHVNIKNKYFFINFEEFAAKFKDLFMLFLYI